MHKRIKRFIQRWKWRLTPLSRLGRLRHLQEHILEFKKRSNIHAAPSGRPRRIRWHGRAFIETFPVTQMRLSPYALKIVGATGESLVGVGFTDRFHSHASDEYPVALAKIGFERDAVTIEAIQGEKKAKEKLDQLSKTIGSPWPQFIIQQIEKHAKQMGFNAVKIRRPESSWFYYWEKDHVPHSEEIKKRIRTFYALCARKNHYIKKGDFYVKELE